MENDRGNVGGDGESATNEVHLPIWILTCIDLAAFRSNRAREKVDGDRLGARERFDCPFSVGSYKRKRKKYVFLVIIIDSLREHTMRVAVYDNVTLNRKYKWAWNDTVYF